MGCLPWELPGGAEDARRDPPTGQWETVTSPPGSERAPGKCEVFSLSARRVALPEPWASGKLSGLCRRGVPRPGSRDHELAELARPADLGFSCLLPPSWQRPRNAHRYKTDFVFGMFWSLDSKGCIKAFLWGWLSAGENHAGAADQSIPGDLPTECHVLARGWVRGGPGSGARRALRGVSQRGFFWVRGAGSSEERWAGSSEACTLSGCYICGALVSLGPGSHSGKYCDGLDQNGFR